ncbi:sugar ABC transporter permease [soil metagenome]
MNLAVLAGVVVGVPAITLGYIWLADGLIDAVGTKLGRSLRPWVWLFPALALTATFLVVPSVLTAIASFRTPAGGFGIENYDAILQRDDTRQALTNNALWLVVVVVVVMVLGTLLALGADRVRYERAVTTVLFLPMAVSATAASVLWQQVYAFQPRGRPQTGTLNALWTGLGFEPVAWLLEKSTNNWALMVVCIWTWTGLALVVILAGVKGLPEDVIEAARVDGATQGQLLRRIVIPLLRPTLAVVATTLIVFVLKVFDIVQGLTRGERGTEVLANAMFTEFFQNRREGTASAIAVVLMLLVLPMVILAVRRSMGGADR